MSKVSVIVPVYKVEPFLPRCIDSILAQSFEDFELILVDDGSPDGCPRICDEYAKKDNRVAVIHQKNAGVSAARNAGLDWIFANSDCEWVSFIDSDDWVHPQYLELLYYTAFNTSDCDVSICLYQKTDKFFCTHKYFDNPPTIDVYSGIETQTQSQVESVIPCCKLYRKHLFSQIRYPVGKRHEDEFVTYKILFKASSVAVIQKELYYYYQRADSFMQSETLGSRLDFFDARIEKEKFYIDNGLNDLAHEQSIIVESNLSELILKRKDSLSKKELKHARSLYWRLVHTSHPIWSKKFCIERYIFAVSPQLLSALYSVKTSIFSKK